MPRGELMIVLLLTIAPSCGALVSNTVISSGTWRHEIRQKWLNRASHVERTGGRRQPATHSWNWLRVPGNEGNDHNYTTLGLGVGVADQVNPAGAGRRSVAGNGV